MQDTNRCPYMGNSKCPYFQRPCTAQCKDMGEPQLFYALVWGYPVPQTKGVCSCQDCKCTKENNCGCNMFEKEEPLKETIEEPIKETIEEPIKETIEEPLKETIEEPIKETIEEPIKETIEEVQEALRSATDEVQKKPKGLKKVASKLIRMKVKKL